jgi:hypothetical protein
MKATYVASDNSTGDAQVLGAVGQDVLVKKVIFGTGADSKIIRFYNKRVAPGHASGIGSVSSTDLALHFAQPTAAAGKDWVRVLEFTHEFCEGLRLDGGSFHTDASNVTVLWDLAEQD